MSKRKDVTFQVQHNINIKRVENIKKIKIFKSRQLSKLRTEGRKRQVIQCITISCQGKCQANLHATCPSIILHKAQPKEIRDDHTDESKFIRPKDPISNK